MHFKKQPSHYLRFYHLKFNSPKLQLANSEKRVAKGFSVTRDRAQIIALFPRSSTSDFLRSNDNRILVIWFFRDECSFKNRRDAFAILKKINEWKHLLRFWIRGTGLKVPKSSMALFLITTKDISEEIRNFPDDVWSLIWDVIWVFWS